MATIIDPEELKREATVVEDEPEAIEEYANLSEPAEAEPVEEAPVVEEPAAEDDLPEKYRGKSASDIARMHQELEKRLGQQSQEVGELRQHFDNYVRSQAPAPTPEAPVEEIDFFADPAAAVAKAIENHPSLQQAQAVASEMAKKASLEKLQARHPDMQEVLADAGFQEWVGGSEFRKQMFQDADRNYNFAAADELLSLYKERKGVAKQVEKVEKVARKQAVKDASTGSARSNPEGQTSRKVYRRRDIIELMNTDPKRYESLMPEIMKAYEEGRVK